tara:strand:+ start:5541 stop:6509 length:969 start_codon:yes stop_codon:yes gene_type:complete
MKNYTAQSYWVSKKKGIIKEESINKPLEKDELLVKTYYSGISYGTEKIVFDSQVPVNQYKFMRAPHQVGEFNKEVKYGYLSVGEVIEGPKAMLNKMVYTMFPHQSMYTLKSSQATLIPSNIPYKRALLTANMETAINAMWDSKPTIGDKVYVLGAGIVGILMAYVLSRTFGITVIVVDKDISKKRVCKHLDIEFENSINCISNPDIIYECTGNASVLSEIIKKAPLETKICILSWYGKQESKIKMGENCFSRRLELIFSQVGNITSIKTKKWNNLSRRSLALDLLDDMKLDILIDKKEITLKDLPLFFKKGNINGLCKVVRY